MPTQVASRLDPAIFRLPVERIRDGYYSDAYFVHTKSLLEAEGHHPRVTMQIFQKRDSVLGGIDEAIAVSRGARATGPPMGTGSTAGTSSRSTPCTRGRASRRARP